jgi:beta-galactosidase
MKISWNDGWTYTEKFESDLLLNPCNLKDLTEVRLPHTTQEIPFNYFDEKTYQKLAGYRRTFRVKKEWQDQRMIVTFEGAAHQAEVYLNGVSLGKHDGGYTAFKVELTNHILKDEENVLVVKLDTRGSLNIPPFGHVIDYLTYGGLYREVFLEIKSQTYIEDVFVKTDQVLSDNKIINVDLSLNNICKDLDVSFYLSDFNMEIDLGKQALSETSNTFTFEQKNLDLWSLENPKLYSLTCKLYKGETFIDEYRVTFGFREAIFKNDGFYLNGERIKLLGLNRHQSYPYVGYAMPKGPQERDAVLLKHELGLNCVRTSHYPQSKHFIRKCDEIGLLVFTEFPGWQHIGDDLWKESAYNQLNEMILQYRNHPSIILWGVRINESVDDHEFYLKTNRIAKLLDPTRQTGGVRYTKKSELLEDVYTYNDFKHNGSNQGLEVKRKVTPDRNAPYLISEYNGHMFPTKSFDSESHRLDHALRHANVLDDVFKYKEIIGGFGWCMFDYNTHKDFGSGDRICYHGVMDFFRNKKMAAYVYESQKNNKPLLEISSSFDVGEHPGGFKGDIYAFTNCEKIKIYKNDELLKTYSRKNSPYKHLPNGPILLDDFIGEALIKQEEFSERKSKKIKEVLSTISKYGPDNIPSLLKLKALGILTRYKISLNEISRLYTTYVGDWGQKKTVYRFEGIIGNDVVIDFEKRTSENVKIHVDVDRNLLVDGLTYDVACVNIQARSESNQVLHYYQEAIVLKTEGPIEIIGPRIITLKGGMFGTYIKSTGESGKGKLYVSGDHIDTHIDFEIIKK